ncbi:MAG: hypothetical protein HZA00_03355 [Nitrospinae bacterium]|nr:hypothetical protein [Nitrospinota bacterium]
MKKIVSLGLIFLFVTYLGVTNVSATPSTTYWTTSTSDVQPYGVWHLGIDNYFTLFKDKGTLGTESGSLTNAPVFGLTVGVLPFEKLNMEVGVDMIEGTYDTSTTPNKNYPLFFNGKLGTPEGSLFEGSPALNIGMWNIGTKAYDSNTGFGTNYNIIHAMVGKTLPSDMGRLHVGYYTGNDKLLFDATSTATPKTPNNSGFMIGYDKWLVKDKFMFAADWATGKNAISGGGFGIYWFYTPSVSLLMGPVFPDKDTYGKDWVWTTQMDINF